MRFGATLAGSRSFIIFGSQNSEMHMITRRPAVDIRFAVIPRFRMSPDMRSSQVDQRQDKPLDSSDELSRFDR
jgi:hypothetical protein